MAKVLLAEDDEFLRDIYTEILKEEHFDIDTAKDGNEALQKLQAGGWDIVLLDVFMPQMTGIEVLKHLDAASIRSLAKHIVFMTNAEESKELPEIKDMIDGYFIKSSLTPGQVVEKVKELLQS